MERRIGAEDTVLCSYETLCLTPQSSQIQRGITWGAGGGKSRWLPTPRPLVALRRNVHPSPRQILISNSWNSQLAHFVHIIRLPE